MTLSTPKPDFDIDFGSIPLGRFGPSTLTWMVWPPARVDQKHVAHGGETRRGAWAKFCRWVEREHAGDVYAKSRGPQWAPVANIDGHRCKESTAGISALALDCDGAVDWELLLGGLEAVGAAYLAYRSAGHTPEKPKWRLVLPFEVPFIVQMNGLPYNEAANRAWRALYHHARGLFGHLAGGAVHPVFDKATASIAQVFYLGHRRTVVTPVREVRWRDGLPLDGAALMKGAIEVGGIEHHDGEAGSRGPAGTRRGLAFRGFTEVKVPADTPITLTQDGREIATVGLGSVRGKSHCLCPDHGGSGRGSAWVDHTPGGGPIAFCSYCAKYWVPWRLHGPTDEELDQLLAEAMLEHHHDDEVQVGVERYWQALSDAVDVGSLDAYWDSIGAKDRVARRKAEADTLTEGVLAGARYCEQLGKGEWFHALRKFTWEAGLTDKAAPCQRVACQLVGNVATGGQRSRTLPCGKLTCHDCGPRNIALKAAAAAFMPLWRGGPMMAPSLANGGVVYIYPMPVSELDAWKRRFRTARRTRSVLRTCTTTGTENGSSVPSLATAPTERGDEHAYVVFRAGRRVTVVTTLPMDKRGAPVTAPVTGHARIAKQILDLAKQSIRLELDPHIGVVVLVKIESSQNLCLDPDRICRVASRNACVVEVSKAVGPGRQEGIYKAAGVDYKRQGTTVVALSAILDPVVRAGIRTSAQLSELEAGGGSVDDTTDEAVTAELDRLLADALGTEDPVVAMDAVLAGGRASRTSHKTAVPREEVA